MTRDDIIRMAREAGFSQPWTAPKETQERLARFASLIAAAERKTRALEQEPVAWVKHDGEIVVRIDYGGRLYYSEQNIYTADVVRKAIEAEREKVAQWMIQRSYATGHGDTIEDMLEEMEWQVRESERKAILNILWDYAGRKDLSDSDESLLKHLVDLIRARGEA